MGTYSGSGGASGFYLVGIPMGWCTFLPVSGCCGAGVCTECKRQMRFRKKLLRIIKLAGGHGPICPQGKSCACVVDFFVLPCSIVRGVWSCCINDKFIPLKKKKASLEFPARCHRPRNLSIFCKRSCQVPSLLPFLSLSLLTGEYNFLVFSLIQQFPSSRSKRKVNILILFLFKGHREATCLSWCHLADQ